MKVFIFFSIQNSETFDVSHFFPINRRKVINYQKQSLFGPPYTL